MLSGTASRQSTNSLQSVTSIWPKKVVHSIPFKTETYFFSLSSVISSQPETVLWSVRAIPESPYSLAVCISDSTVNLPSLCRV